MFYYENFAKDNLDSVRMCMLKNVVKEFLILIHGWGEQDLSIVDLDNMHGEPKPYSYQVCEYMRDMKTKSNTLSGISRYTAVQKHILSNSLISYVGDSMIESLKAIDGEQHFFNVMSGRVGELRALNNSLYSFIGCSSIVVSHYVIGQLLNDIIIRTSAMKFLVNSMSTSWKVVYEKLYKDILRIAIRTKRVTSTYIDTRNFICVHYSADKILSRHSYILKQMIDGYPYSDIDDESDDVRLMKNEGNLIHECFDTRNIFINDTSKRRKYGGMVDIKKVLKPYRKKKNTGR